MTMRLVPLLILAACSAPPEPRGSTEGMPPPPELPDPPPDAALPPDATQPPDATLPNAATTTALIVSLQTVPQGGTLVQINRGSDHGVAVGWTAHVLDANGNPLPGGSFAVSKVAARHCAGQSSLPMSTLNRSTLRVRLVP